MVHRATVANRQRALQDELIASGVATLTSLASAATGAEQRDIPSLDSAGVEHYAKQSIFLAEGKGRCDVFSDGICTIRPGCVTNRLRALRENLRPAAYGESGMRRRVQADCRAGGRIAESREDGSPSVPQFQNQRLPRCSLRKLDGFGGTGLPAFLRNTLTGAAI